jgi:tetratricopeptide (TPR) repeat protein
MRGGFLGAAWGRWAGWRRRQPALALGALLLVAALLGWAGYRAYGYFTTRGQLRAARQALDRRAWTAAREHLEECLRAWPDSPEAHRLAARAARRLELLDEAQEHLDACERLQSEETHAVQVERALLRVHRGDLAGAEKFLRACVARDDPDTVEILDVLSAALIIDYRVPEAHRCLDELLRRRPDDFDALVRRAWTAESQTWYTVAVESLRKALELRPDAYAVRLSLVQNLLTLGRYADALEQVEYLRERQPDDPAVRFARARCLAGQGEKGKALRLLDGLLAEEPNNWTVLGERGRLCLELDRPGEAEGYLRRAQALAPPNQALLMRLSDCLRLLGKRDDARRYRDKADRLRADTLRALELTKRIRAEGPGDPDLCHALASVLLRLGKDKERDALHFFQKALEKDPRHRPTHEALAAFYEKAGDTGRAAYHRRQLGQGSGVRGQEVERN